MCTYSPDQDTTALVKEGVVRVILSQQSFSEI